MVFNSFFINLKFSFYDLGKLFGLGRFYCYTRLCVCTCEGPQLLSSVFLNCPPLHLLRQGLWQALCSPAEICLQSAGITGDSHTCPALLQVLEI